MKYREPEPTTRTVACRRFFVNGPTSHASSVPPVPCDIILRQSSTIILPPPFLPSQHCDCLHRSVTVCVRTVGSRATGHGERPRFSERSDFGSLHKFGDHATTSSASFRLRFVNTIKSYFRHLRRSETSRHPQTRRRDGPVCVCIQQVTHPRRDSETARRPRPTAR